MISAFKATSLLVVFNSSSNIDFEGPQGEECFRLAFPEMETLPLSSKATPGPRPELPRFVFANEDKSHLVEVLRGRVQVRYVGLQGGTSLGEAFEQFLPFVRRTHSFFSEQGLKVTRLGYVVHLFRHLGQSANQRIMEYFFRRNFFGRAEQVQVHVHTRLSLGDILANRWIRVHPLHTADSSHRDTGILVMIDLNSLAEQAYTFSSKEIERFLEAGTDHIQQQIEFLRNGQLAD